MLWEALLWEALLWKTLLGGGGFVLGTIFCLRDAFGAEVGVDMGSSSSTASLPFGPAKVSFIFAFTGSVEAFGGPVFARFERGPLSFMSKNGGENLTKNRAGKGGGAGDGSDYILQLRISVLEQVTMHSYHIDGEGSLAGRSLFSLNFEVSWPFQGPRRPFCRRQ